MLATGALLVSLALLTLAALGPVFRSSNPPRWTTRGWIGELVTLAIVCTLALGIGYLGAGGISAYQQGPSWVDLVALAAVLAAVTVIWRRLRVRARLTAREAAASAPVIAPGSSVTPTAGHVTTPAASANATGAPTRAA